MRILSGVSTTIASVYVLLANNKRNTRTKVSRSSTIRYNNDSCRTVLIDVENLRGTTGFALSHDDVLKTMRQLDIPGRIVLIVDHGNIPSNYLLKEYAILFSGNHQKADDVIARTLLPFLTTHRNNNDKDNDQDRITVVTKDRGLIRRCLKFSRVDITPPALLLDDLEDMIAQIQHHQTNPPNELLSLVVDPTTASGLVTNHQLQLGAEILEIDAQLRKTTSRNKRNKTMRTQLRMQSQNLWQELLKESPRMIERIQDLLKLGTSCDSFQELTKWEQQQLVSKWYTTTAQSRHRETTEDRMVLAEDLRQRILQQMDTVDSSVDLEPRWMSYFERRSGDPSETLDHTFNTTIIPPNIQSFPMNTLTLVVISDTHGMEHQLESPLPQGDVLLHLGDFAVHRKSLVTDQVREFDQWLGMQPHTTKIVLRGNHDPRSGVLQNARYITSPTTLKIGDFQFAFVPFVAGSMARRNLLPNQYDVLVSHEPPYKVLDRCLCSTYAGSRSLQKAASKSMPLLWLCGHIHEGRGVVRHHNTIVVNAANANPGRAQALVHGPTVIRIAGPPTPRHDRVQITEMNGRYTFMNQDNPSFFNPKPIPGTSPLLLAVDLGLRTGISMFSGNGSILKYEQFHFEDPNSLREGATKILSEWPSVLSGSTITHIAIEGEDPPLVEAWRSALAMSEMSPSLLFVKPNEWRVDLLSEQERRSGASAKVSSQHLAQRELAEQGYAKDGCILPEDVAESILLGMHISRRLGWVNDPTRYCRI